MIVEVQRPDRARQATDLAGLDGVVRSIRGVLASAMLARAIGMHGIVIPDPCAAEAEVVDGITVHAVRHLGEILAPFRGKQALRAPSPGRASPPRGTAVDMAEVRGQNLARTAIEVAVAGVHNVLLSGPPGTGTSMLSRRISSILLEMTRAEALETTKIYSALGLATDLIDSRPFRAPHHTISSAALIGGGSTPRPGEISLAHNGVLFLDELPSSRARPSRDCASRSRNAPSRSTASTAPSSPPPRSCSSPRPTPARAAGSIRAPANAPAAPRQRLSGPLLDRIDLHVYVRPVPLAELRRSEPGESSAAIRARVVAARDRQLARLRPFHLRCNAEMPSAVQRATCKLDSLGERTLADLVQKRRSFTARSIDRLIKVARTLADLLGQDDIDAGCLLEAASFRDVDPTADLVPHVM